MTNQPPTSSTTLGKVVQGLIDLMPLQPQALLRLSAIPNAFSPQLLRELSGKDLDIAAMVEELKQSHLLDQGAGDWYYYETDVRQVLNAYWLQPEHQQEFLRANRAALIFFENLVSQTTPPASYTFQAEVIYHRLLQDEKAGLEYLATQFEQVCDLHLFGVAENYLNRLDLALPQLTSEAQDHRSYYQARLDYANDRFKDLDIRVETLMAKTLDPLLHARAGLLLGQVRTSLYQWGKSSESLTACLAQFKRLKLERYAAQTLLALGNNFVELAKYSGGWETDISETRTWLRKLAYILLNLPYVCLDWLRRKIIFFPALFFFNGNYQDWILNYMLRRGGYWFKRARKVASRIKDDPLLLDALMGQALVASQQHREARAQQIYTQISRHPATQTSRYRLGQVSFGLGQTHLVAGNPGQARSELEQALQIFRSFDDERQVAASAFQLGLAHQALRELEPACTAFLESLQACRTAQDPLLETRVSIQLENLAGTRRLPAFQDDEIQQALNATPEHHFLARFPAGLLQRFRALAYLIALPISYFFILLIGIASSISLLAVETLQLQLSGVITPVDLVLFVVITVLPIPLAIWTIELVYCLVGQLGLFVIAGRKLDSLGEQPDRIVVGTEHLSLLHVTNGKEHFSNAKWSEIEMVFSANYALWRKPISLFSRQIIAGREGLISLDGIASGYERIAWEIRKRVSPTAKQINADIVLAANHWTYLTLLVSVLHAGYLRHIGQINIYATDPASQAQIPLFWSILFIFMIINSLIIFPAVMLWRVYWHRRILTMLPRYQATAIGSSLLPIIAILMTIIAVVWLVGSLKLKVGDDTVHQIAASAHQQLTFIDLNKPSYNVGNETNRL